MKLRLARVHNSFLKSYRYRNGAAERYRHTSVERGFHHVLQFLCLLVVLCKHVAAFFSIPAVNSIRFYIFFHQVQGLPGGLCSEPCLFFSKIFLYSVIRGVEKRIQVRRGATGGAK